MGDELLLFSFHLVYAMRANHHLDASDTRGELYSDGCEVK